MTENSSSVPGGDHWSQKHLWHLSSSLPTIATPHHWVNCHRGTVTTTTSHPFAGTRRRGGGTYPHASTVTWGSMGGKCLWCWCKETGTLKTSHPPHARLSGAGPRPPSLPPTQSHDHTTRAWTVRSCFWFIHNKASIIQACDQVMVPRPSFICLHWDLTHYL